MRLRLLDVPVDGGNLRVLLWGTGRQVAVAVHGITGSAMAWQAVARQMPSGWTLAAPDLRGRGHSRDLPGPYGLGQHAADVAAVLRRLGNQPVLAGHSMGAYVALLARDAHPRLARRLVLVDGGLPLPVPDGADPDELLGATLGPAVDRLRQTFPDTEAYLDYWRAHPALAGHWSADVEAYVRYDLTGEAGALRSRVAAAAVQEDHRDLLTGKPFGEALGRLRDPTRLLTAPAGLSGVPPPLLPPELVAAWRRRAPQLRPKLVPGVNHYTILFGPAGVAAIVQAITAR
ncbi:MAG TPA: alpha/beta hydrolase [Streptosporangiaceae bacterium]|jgi:lipase|nr:alpha/beta hydrolase [Streptosporangiaceae bacterium]